MRQRTYQDLPPNVRPQDVTTSSAPAVIDRFMGRYAFLSNTAKTPITLSTREGAIEFPTLEHGFHYAKSLDPRQRAWVLAAPTWQEAKRRGRAVQLRSDWNAFMRFLAMDTGLRAKFVPGSDLASRLLATEDATLIEGNHWHDNDWGDCRCGQPRCQQPGHNWLGKMLMSLRHELRHPDALITPLSQMTGVPGLCRVHPAAVPDELVAAVTRQPELTVTLGGDPRPLLARILELYYPKSAAEGAAQPSASILASNLAGPLVLPRPATSGRNIPGPIPYVDPVPDPRNPRPAWRRTAAAGDPVEVLWNPDEAQASGAHMVAAGADLKAAAGATEN